MTTYTVACRNPHCYFTWAACRPGPEPLYCPRCGYHRFEAVQAPQSADELTEGGVWDRWAALLDARGSIERLPGETDLELRRRLYLSLKANLNNAVPFQLEEKQMDTNFNTTTIRYALKTTLLATGAIIRQGAGWAFYLPNVFSLVGGNVGGAGTVGNVTGVGSGVTQGWSDVQANLETRDLSAITALGSINPSTVFPNIDAAVDHYITVLSQAYIKAQAAA